MRLVSNHYEIFPEFQPGPLPILPVPAGDNDLYTQQQLIAYRQAPTMSTVVDNQELNSLIEDLRNHSTDSLQQEYVARLEAIRDQVYGPPSRPLTAEEQAEFDSEYEEDQYI